MPPRPHASNRLDRLAQSWHAVPTSVADVDGIGIGVDDLDGDWTEPQRSLPPLAADHRDADWAEPQRSLPPLAADRLDGDWAEPQRSLPPIAADRAVGFAADTEQPPWRERVTVGLDGRARRAVVALVAVVVTVAAYMWWTGRPVETTPLLASATTLDGAGAAGGAVGAGDGVGAGGAVGLAVDGVGAEVVVHVVGAVRKPGLVRLPVGARVADAVDAAGGATRPRALSSVNLARVLVDGEQIVVGQAAGTSASGGKVSLSNADAAALEDLPGIGPALAARIVAWRETYGPFTSVDALDEVSGIGPAVLAQLRDLVTP